MIVLGADPRIRQADQVWILLNGDLSSTGEAHGLHRKLLNDHKWCRSQGRLMPFSGCSFRLGKTSRKSWFRSAWRLGLTVYAPTTRPSSDHLFNLRPVMQQRCKLHKSAGCYHQFQKSMTQIKKAHSNRKDLSSVLKKNDLVKLSMI